MRWFGKITGLILGGIYGGVRWSPYANDMSIWFGILFHAGIGVLFGAVIDAKISESERRFKHDPEFRSWWKWWKAGFDKTSWKKLNTDIFNPDLAPVEDDDNPQEEPSSQVDVFTRTLATLMAAVAQADGEVSEGEIRRVRKYFIGKFTVSQAEEWVKIFEFQAFQVIDHVAVCKSILNDIDYYARLQLFGILADLAAEDGLVSDEERMILEEIGDSLGIAASDKAPAGFKAFHTDEGPYGILGIPRNASGDEIKRAHHRLVLQYHPDKVMHLGQNYADVAAEKFRSIHQAYEEIMSSRNIN